MEKKYPTLEENSMKMWLIKYMHVIELELELELMLFRWMWERGEKASILSKNKRACVRCVMSWCNVILYMTILYCIFTIVSSRALIATC